MSNIFDSFAAQLNPGQANANKQAMDTHSQNIQQQAVPNPQQQPQNIQQLPQNIQEQQPQNISEQNQANPPPQGLDKFKDWFTMDESPAQSGQKPSIYDIDPAQLDQGVANLSFTDGMNPELLQKAFQEQDVQAFSQLLNDFGRQLYKANFMASMGAMKSVNGVERQNYQELIQEQLRNNSTKQATETLNPALQNPAAAPIVDLLTQQLRTKYPAATPADIAGKVQEYVTAFAEATNPQQKPAEQPQQTPSQSWENFFK